MTLMVQSVTLDTGVADRLFERPTSPTKDRPLRYPEPGTSGPARGAHRSGRGGPAAAAAGPLPRPLPGCFPVLPGPASLCAAAFPAILRHL
jgi:hypothetical protein